jgi:group I intron endonuclease
MYKVYKITNTINGHFYVGYTSLDIQQRWKLHCNSGSLKMPIYRAIQKYGSDSFNIELLESFETKTEAVNREMELIAESKPEYNIHPGGTGGPMFGPMNGMFGKLHSDEWKAVKSVQMTGPNNPMYGKTHSPEVKQRLSAMKAGLPSYNKGVPMAEHIKEKLRKPKSECHKEQMRSIYKIDGEMLIYNAKEYCKTAGHNYICFTQAAKNNKPYKGHTIERVK